MRSPIKPIAALPTRIAKKIELEPVTSGERHACWMWKGAITAARQRFARRADADYAGKVGNFVNERPTPSVRSPELGYPVAAHRAIYAECHEISIRDVPRLQRCVNDRCVSPWHTVTIGPVRAHKPAQEPQDAPWTYERCLNRLRAADVSPSYTPNEAADEAGIPREHFNRATWQAYSAEDPEEDGH